MTWTQERVTETGEYVFRSMRTKKHYPGLHEMLKGVAVPNYVERWHEPGGLPGGAHDTAGNLVMVDDDSVLTEEAFEGVKALLDDDSPGNVVEFGTEEAPNDTYDTEN